MGARDRFHHRVCRRPGHRHQRRRQHRFHAGSDVRRPGRLQHRHCRARGRSAGRPHRVRRDRVRPDEAARFDHEPVRHPHDRAHPDRDRDQHHPRPDRRGRPQGARLPRLDRHDPGRRPRRPDRRRADRRPDEPDLDLRPAATAPVRVRRAVLHRRGRDRPGRRPRRPVRLLPEPAEHAVESARDRGGRGRCDRLRDHVLRLPAVLLERRRSRSSRPTPEGGDAARVPSSSSSASPWRCS